VTEVNNPESLAKPLGLYSHTARTRADETVYIAGQVSVDQSGQIVGVGDLTAQLRQTYANLEAALVSVGADFSDVVKFTTYMTRKEDLAEYQRARSELYAEIYPDGAYPPATLVFVAGLVSENLLIEVEAIAARS
jgi:enamine deaminase RidA (YjgF/YER057c/UK114 family)